jgi:hypothetical protein
MKARSSAAALMMFACGCFSGNRGFRFEGEYRAPKSHIEFHVVSQGFVSPDADIADTALALLQICPSGTSDGRPFRLSMVSAPKAWIKIESPDLAMEPGDWNWKTSEAALAKLLEVAGYRGVAVDEIRDLARAMGNSSSGPKGFIMEGQGQSVVVLRADIHYGYAFDETKPQATWIPWSDLSACAASERAH